MKGSSHPPEERPPLGGPPTMGASKDWLQSLTGFNLRFGRFFRDAVGVFLLVFALTSSFALIELLGNPTQPLADLQSPFAGGLVTGFLASQILLWFGWGGFVVLWAIALAGFILLRKNKDTVNWARIIAVELALLLTLGILAIASGNDLAQAEAGRYGGRLGWGMIALAWRYAGQVFGSFMVVVVWLLAAGTGFGIWSKLEAWLLKFAGEAPLQATPPPSEPLPVSVEEPPQPEKTEPAASPKKKPSQIPPEFRTSFKSAPRNDEKTATPIARSEILPPLGILLPDTATRADDRTINQTAGLIMKTLADFGIPATVVGYRVGPSITQFAVQPGFIKKPGSDEEDMQQMKVRVAQIASLEKDIALALSAQRLRIEAPVPGKPYVGIEVPNSHSAVVRMKSLLESEIFNKMTSPLRVVLGRDVSGNPLVADLARMPHLLIAGATGSGKSVCITSLAACLAMNNSPADLRIIMIDAKMVELIRFNGLPHLFGKVETNLERILGVLRWVVLEMEHRYRLLESAHARDLESYNRKIVHKSTEKPLPRIVVFIDELADLMMSAPDVTEHNLVRLAQMARATGIHLIVATQRPSTDVVTGLIKANFPARLAFSVASGIDSRVILDYTGAESLLGRGDMLFLNPEFGTPVRAQGVMITDMEIERILSHWQKSSIKLDDTPPWDKLLQESEEEDEGLLEQAVSIVRSAQRASASLIQRRLRIGYPRAARLLDQLEQLGVVGPSHGGGKDREVLPAPDDFDQADKNG